MNKVRNLTDTIAVEYDEMTYEVSYRIDRGLRGGWMQPDDADDIRILSVTPISTPWEDYGHMEPTEEILIDKILNR